MRQRFVAAGRASGGWEFAVPQEASVCLNQVGSESEELPPDDSASLHIAQNICFACRRLIEDGHPYTVVHVDDETEPAVGKLHNICANEWLMRLAYAIGAPAA